MMVMIDYTLKRFKKSKHLRILVKAGGKVVVTAPWRVSVRFVEEFVGQQIRWIEEKVGQSLRLGNRESTPLGKVGKGGEEYRLHRERALQIVTERLEHFQKMYGFQWKKVGIRNQSTRWGSCARSGNLSFNYKVVFLPVDLVDYLVVHEMCHLKEMNHSVRFWRLVEKAIPDFVEKRRALRRWKMTGDRPEVLWSVYVLRCADQTLYTGIALNVDERLRKHNEGKGAKYTRGRGPCEVVWREDGLDGGDARRREVEIKKMSRGEKEDLVKNKAPAV